MKVWFSIVISLGFVLHNSAQISLDEGLRLLEGKNYKEAEAVLDSFLAINPQNLTAQICLGRAIGLGGRSAEATTYFDALSRRLPNNIEVRLNLAESYMWHKSWQEAVEVYSSVLSKDPSNQISLEGIANAHSALKNFDAALVYINKSLSEYPDSPNARISRNYILLGLSNKLKEEGRFKEAMSMVNGVLTEQPNLVDALRLKTDLSLAMNLPFTAMKVCRRLDKHDPCFASLGRANAFTLIGWQQFAIRQSEAALEKCVSSKAPFYKNAIMTHLNSLINNRQYDGARDFLSKLPDSTLYMPQIALARSRMQALDPSIEKIFTNSWENDLKEEEFQLIQIDRHRRNGEYTKAESLFDLLQNDFQTKPGLRQLKKQLSRESRSPFFLMSKRTQDLDDNNHFINTIVGTIRLNDYHGIRLLASLDNTEKSNINLSANQTNFLVGYEFRKWNKLTFSVESGFSRTSRAASILYRGGIEYKPNTDHSFSLFFENFYENYTLDLLNNQLQRSSASFKYHFSRKGWPSLYSEANLSTYSDDNFRWLGFGSLYYTLLELPILKGGINYLYITFDSSISQLYFSPSVYNTLELFFQIENINSLGSKYLYSILLAGGTQSIDKESTQSLLRSNVSVGYRISKSCDLFLNGEYSSSARSTIAGFTYYSYGLKMNFWL